MDTCVICDGVSTKPYCDGIIQCRECGHVYYGNRPDEAQIRRLYGERYFCGDEYSSYVADKRTVQKNFRLRLGVLGRFLDPARHKRLLEIGCAYGFFLDLVRDRFDTAQGIDISEEGVRYAREELRLDAVCADFLKYDFGDRGFDIVCMWDTIEHLVSPQAYIQKIGAHMESGGLLALTTGDIGSLSARIQKGRWRLIHPPTHVHYFSQKTLTKLLDKNGFDVLYQRHCGFYRSIDMIAYRLLVLKKRWPALHALARKTGLSGVDLYSNLYDISYFIGRKR
jgi:SAM-dependent methyltransferase